MLLLFWLNQSIKMIYLVEWIQWLSLLQRSNAKLHYQTERHLFHQFCHLLRKHCREGYQDPILDFAQSENASQFFDLGTINGQYVGIYTFFLINLKLQERLCIFQSHILLHFFRLEHWCKEILGLFLIADQLKRQLRPMNIGPYDHPYLNSWLLQACQVLPSTPNQIFWYF